MNKVNPCDHCGRTPKAMCRIKDAIGTYPHIVPAGYECDCGAKAENLEKWNEANLAPPERFTVATLAKFYAEAAETGQPMQERTGSEWSISRVGPNVDDLVKHWRVQPEPKEPRKFWVVANHPFDGYPVALSSEAEAERFTSEWGGTAVPAVEVLPND